MFYELIPLGRFSDAAPRNSSEFMFLILFFLVILGILFGSSLISSLYKSVSHEEKMEREKAVDDAKSSAGCLFQMGLFFLVVFIALPSILKGC